MSKFIRKHRRYELRTYVNDGFRLMMSMPCADGSLASSLSLGQTFLLQA